MLQVSGKEKGLNTLIVGEIVTMIAAFMLAFCCFAAAAGCAHHQASETSAIVRIPLW